MRAEQPTLQSSPTGLAIRGRIDRAHVEALCDRAFSIIEAADAEVVVCDVGDIVEPDASAVDALARLQLSARRVGRRIRLSHASPPLRELLALMGLGEVVPVDAGSALQAMREPEQREIALGVEEEDDPGDLSI